MNAATIGPIIDAVIGIAAIFGFAAAGVGIVGMIIIVLRDGGPWHVSDYELEEPDEPATLTDKDGFEVIETGVYDKEEIHHNCTVQVWTNSVTGETSVGWWQNGGGAE